MPEGKPETVFEVVERDGMLMQRGRIKLPYKWAAGRTASRFLVGLRDEQRIYGIRCPGCKTVFVPPKRLCHRCSVQMSEWIELGDEGLLETFTIVRYSEPAIHPMEAPFAYGIIKLEGADSGMVHIIGEADLERLRVGQRVKAVFSEERRGNYLDIKYFKPV